MRPNGHLVAATERPPGPPLKLHPVPRHVNMRRTYETCCRTRQGKHDRSTDHMGAPLHVTLAVTPDIISMARPNTTDQARPSCIVT